MRTVWDRGSTGVQNSYEKSGATRDKDEELRCEKNKTPPTPARRARHLDVRVCLAKS